MTRLDIRALRELYEGGENITRHVRLSEGANSNSEQAILYAYEAQSGSYVAAMSDPVFAAHKQKFNEKLARIVWSYAPSSLLDAGTGEGTTFGPIIDAKGERECSCYAFDLVLSRLLVARETFDRNQVQLFTAKLGKIPLPDKSIDVVLTVHALEPNGGRERELLTELWRVTKKHLILLEPAYELASEASRARMVEHGYVRNLTEHLSAIGASVSRYEKWNEDDNPLNEAGLIVANRDTAEIDEEKGIAPGMVSPLSGGKLIPVNGGLFCPLDGYVFPVIEGIPCLLEENGILASALSRGKEG
jgi:ubiquinone/menaquinone biosynthesis C-methylase UbiE